MMDVASPYTETLSPGYINAHISCYLSLGIAEGAYGIIWEPTLPGGRVSGV
jgi:hypothetical protein